MKRRVTALLLAVMMVALVACTPAASTPTAAPVGATAAPGSGAAAPATQYPIVDEPITVTGVRHTGQDRDNKEPRYTWERLEEVTGIHVDITYLPEEAQLPVFLAAGNWPDFFHDNLKSNFINEFGVLGGKFVDYNTLADLMPNLQKVYEQYPDARKAYTQTNGAVYQLFTLVLA